jgi:hypothetical protein
MRTDFNNLILELQREKRATKRNEIFGKWLEEYNLHNRFLKLDISLQTKVRHLIMQRAIRIKNLETGVILSITSEIISDAEKGLVIEPDNDGQRLQAKV